jgi:hypothetical protein
VARTLLVHGQHELVAEKLNGLVIVGVVFRVLGAEPL